MEFEEHLYLEQPFRRLLNKLPTSSLRRARRRERGMKKEKTKQIGVEAERDVQCELHLPGFCVLSLQKRVKIKAQKARTNGRGKKKNNWWRGEESCNGGRLLPVPGGVTCRSEEERETERGRGIESEYETSGGLTKGKRKTLAECICSAEANWATLRRFGGPGHLCDKINLCSDSFVAFFLSLTSSF